MSVTWCKIKAEISALAEKAREQVSRCNPLLLMGRCNKIAAHEFIMPCPKESEWVLNSPGMLRAVEYAHTLLVSTKSNFDDSESLETQERRITEALDTINKLYNRAMPIILFVGEMLNECGVTIMQPQQDAIGMMVNMYNVRGRRDVSFMREVFDSLLLPHEDIIWQSFGIHANCVVEGLIRLQDKVRLGLIHLYLKKYGKDFSKVFHNIKNSPSLSEIETLFDVHNIVDWPDSLISRLTLGLNSDHSFLEGHFSAWPIKDSIVKDKPFVKIRGKTYVFGYYLLCDFFYRAFQRLIKEVNPHYQWKDVQCVAAEETAASIFSSLLPGNVIYSNNYYPDSEHRGQWDENDVIIEYADAIIIIEVKAGKFGHESPIESPRYILRNYENLAKAIDQVRRTERYLTASASPLLYDKDYRVKGSIQSVCGKSIIRVCVTLDNVNEMASCARSINQATGVQSEGIICISLDDLLVVGDFFKSHPSLFLMYLKFREAITHLPETVVWDELDLLSSFIGNPFGVATMKTFIASGSNFVNPGSHTELSDYFNMRNNPQRCFKKPWPIFPMFVSDILEWLDASHHNKSVALISFLVGLELETIMHCQELYLLEKSQQVLRSPGIHLMRNDVGDAFVLTWFFNGVPYGYSLDQLEKDIRIRVGNTRIKHLFLIALIYHGKLDDVVVKVID